jgi:hypothetical protein
VTNSSTAKQHQLRHKQLTIDQRNTRYTHFIWDPLCIWPAAYENYSIYSIVHTVQLRNGICKRTADLQQVRHTDLLQMRHTANLRHTGILYSKDDQLPVRRPAASEKQSTADQQQVRHIVQPFSSRWHHIVQLTNDKQYDLRTVAGESNIRMWGTQNSWATEVEVDKQHSWPTECETHSIAKQQNVNQCRPGMSPAPSLPKRPVQG